ncbi:TRAP transporter substrate-binding protein DctP [Caballeronia sp. LP006]|jgi:TRAP-type C4-dicarboxylate transport system substrate-binding protein|uniref:TRAP transporter substrate-binding protein DctP n=1 Tax=unclassified Caballeronia TaxID=2646786 RepID=UPI00285BFF6A|nr:MULTISPECIES: TRAP transporter substrate-binding protein DctP [unclassified Caballeronia]MDR5773150.1 TRAP transporter substrate-binding protein DctP [Caballeronia sp. LZ002]MDR5827811.1 TRAP transporter substrate-binding protein DctP [Caballeronia sp. LP006]MDR5848584.1 TRAP transporter substrate-binding protein DctP [Caballeronia sp. LZ003]
MQAKRWTRMFTAMFALAAISTAAHADDVVTLKMAHQWPDDPNDYVVQTGKKFAQQVEQKSGGKIHINIFPAESLVKSLNTHTALKNGSADLAIYPYIYSAGAIPQMNLILLPGLWKTPEDVFKFRTSAPWKELEAKIEAYGFKTLCWIQISGGMASKSKPINVPADLPQQKVRGAGKMMEAALQSAGASTVSMASSETYSAMQLGLLDGLWTSSGTFGSYRLYEVAKYYNSPEDYSIYYTIEPIAISMKTWNKLTPEQQKIMTDVGRSLEQSAFEGAKADDRRVAQLFASHNAKIHKMTLDEWNQWQTLFQKVSFIKFRAEVPDGGRLLDQSTAFYK